MSTNYNKNLEKNIFILTFWTCVVFVGHFCNSFQRFAFSCGMHGLCLIALFWLWSLNLTKLEEIPRLQYPTAIGSRGVAWDWLEGGKFPPPTYTNFMWNLYHFSSSFCPQKLNHTHRKQYPTAIGNHTKCIMTFSWFTLHSYRDL